MNVDRLAGCSCGVDFMLRYFASIEEVGLFCSKQKLTCNIPSVCLLCSARGLGILKCHLHIIEKWVELVSRNRY